MRITMGSLIKYFNILFWTVGIIISTSFAQGTEGPLSKSNLKIVVQYKLVQENLLVNNNINVEVEGNKIILSGTVPTIYAKKQAMEEAQSVDQNYTVVNNLTLQIPSIEDSVLSNEILDKIQSNLFYTIYDWITVSSNNGVVTLDGWVHLPWLKNQFQTEIEKISGVKSVNNIVQNSFGPGEIGVRAARLIYNDPRFYGFQNSANPPIHIIVNNNRVILEGYVKSESDINWAENIVSYRTDAFSVTNNLQVKK